MRECAALWCALRFHYRAGVPLLSFAPRRVLWALGVMTDERESKGGAEADATKTRASPRNFGARRVADGAVNMNCSCLQHVARCRQKLLLLLLENYSHTELANANVCTISNITYLCVVRMRNIRSRNLRFSADSSRLCVEISKLNNRFLHYWIRRWHPIAITISNAVSSLEISHGLMIINACWAQQRRAFRSKARLQI